VFFKQELSSSWDGRPRPQRTWAEKRGAAVPLSRGKLGPRLSQCGLGRGLLPYQMASGSIQPFGHNGHDPKLADCAPLGGAGSPSNTTWPGSKATSLPSFTLIHPTVRPQYTNVTRRQDTTGQRSHGIARTVSQTVANKLNVNSCLHATPALFYLPLSLAGYAEKLSMASQSNGQAIMFYLRDFYLSFVFLLFFLA